MLRFLLDTNVLSEVMRDVPDRRVASRFGSAIGVSCTAAPVWFELDKGCKLLANGRRRQRLEVALDRIAERLLIVPYDVAAATWHASEHARLIGAGKTPAFVDAQIAAVAVVNDLVLVTRNVRDFRYFEDLHVESWFT